MYLLNYQVEKYLLIQYLWKPQMIKWHDYVKKTTKSITLEYITKLKMTYCIEICRNLQLLA